MCYECWKEFKGWCKAFTRTEVLLAILEAILLIICVAFLIFLIMHLIVCSSWVTQSDPVDLPDDRPVDRPDDRPYDGPYDRPNVIPPYKTSKGTGLASVTHYDHTTLDPSVKCTWEPSKKTEAVTKYYEDDYKSTTQTTYSPIIVLDFKPTKSKLKDHTPRRSSYVPDVLEDPSQPSLDSMAYDEQSDGEEADDEYKSAVLALVKLRPPRDVTFGCVVTAISQHWTVTAASCVEAVEEIDSLDNFVLMERYGEARRGRTHAIADVQIHPLYQGANLTYDIAALRSEDSLQPAATPLALPTLVDYFLITVGERFSILGFGSFRTIDPAGAARAVRSVAVYSLPGAECRAAAAAGGAGDAWAPRHLSRGREDAHGAGGCGAAPLCAGVRYARGQPCTYCAGTPLVRGRALLGVMAAARACAVACEPALYVSAPLVRDWLDMVLQPDH